MIEIPNKYGGNYTFVNKLFKMVILELYKNKIYFQ